MLGLTRQAGASVTRQGGPPSHARAARNAMTQSIPFVDLARQHGPIASELRAAFERVFGASSYILGEEVERFEEEFAAYCGVRHCVGVASGTAALTIASLASGVRP